MTPAEYVYLDLFIGNFSARQDAYVLDSKAHINEPLTPESLSHHWAGGHSVSGYLSNGDVTQVGAIDLDAGDLTDAKRIRDVLKDAGIPAFISLSRRGNHLWTFHDVLGAPVPANVVRAALTMAVGVSKWPHPMYKAEVFPRQGQSDWSCGALRLPLMPHPKDGKTRVVLAPDDTPLTRISEVVDVVAGMTSDYRSMRAFSGIDTARVPYPHPEAGWAKVRHYDDVPSVSVLLGDLTRPIPGHACHCPFHDDTHSSLSIAKDDERAFCKAPHCDLYNDGRGFGSFQLAAYLKERAS